MIFMNHQLKYFVGYKKSNTIIDMPSRKNYLRHITHRFSFTCQVIRINTDTMTTYQSRMVFQKVPFCGGSFNHIVCIDADPVENKGKFIYEGDIQITLGIFN